MHYIDDVSLDLALARIARDASRLDMTSECPASYADVARVSLGHKIGPQVSAPEACKNGRQITIAAIDDGTATAKGTPKYWCLTGQGRLLACDELDSADPFISGIAFVLPSICVKLLAKPDSEPS
jgi:hypothetical protein